MKSFLQFLEARIPFRKYTGITNDPQKYMSKEEVPIFLDKLFDEGFADNPVELNNCVILRRDLDNFRYNLRQRLPNLMVGGWWKTGGMFATNRKITVFNAKTILRLCELLHISFARNTEKYDPVWQDKIALISPEELSRLVSQIKQENPELFKVKVFGRGYSDKRCYLNYKHFTNEQYKVIEILASEGNIFYYPILEKLFKNIFNGQYNFSYYFTEKV